MKLRPVLFVLLLLSGFYYLTTHVGSTGAMAPWVHHVMQHSDSAEASTASVGTFDLTQASAAPAFDTEEQQNIAVYKKALASVVNITSTQVRSTSFMVLFRSRARDLVSFWTSRA